MSESQKKTIKIYKEIDSNRWDYVKGYALINQISPDEALNRIIFFHETNAEIRDNPPTKEKREVK